ncbi:glutamate ABC transporter substrate-binding protein [Kitasatospora sp. NBC_01287]|uniref:glutamate ABC transporter substrate-binding protein n=1 Tax=Kitasatospora sp. NBC_01287 TaxID=2903573 RepID=UPI00224FF064|nr:glutamate ABC transporter substrate-binding protein [Kitasatospora sp. NBC_01287]MCX4745722.1 glutamate ABC transporter substrate-binding protein [Kitasatospora sp. NBC_01287]
MHVRSRLSLTGAALAAACAISLTACGSSATLPTPKSSGGAAAPTFQQVLDAGPVAPASAIPDGSLMAKIKARGTLNVGGTDTSALFSLKDPVSGKLTGFDAGLAQLLAKYITGKAGENLVLVTADTRETLLQNGTVDTVFATYTITPARAQKVAFAGPYYSSGDAILVAKDNTSITKVDDLAGKTVCTESSSTAANDLKQYAPTAKVILFQTNAECQQAVEQGRADAYVLDQALLLGDQYRDPKVKVVGQPFTSEPYGIGVPLASPEMKAFVNDWLKQIQADGEWAKLWQATIGSVLSGSAPTPPVIGSVQGS